MATTELTQAIEALEKSLGHYSRSEITEDTQPSKYDLDILSEAYSLYKGYFKKRLKREIDNRIVDVYSFRKFADEEAEILPLIAKLKEENNKEEDKEDDEKKKEEEKKDEEVQGEAEEKEEEKEEEKQAAPTKEVATIQANLAELVQLNEEHKRLQQEAGAEPHSTANAIKHARAVWDTKRKAETIRENRLALIQDKTERDNQREAEKTKQDLYLVEVVDPKATATVTRRIESAARQAVLAQEAMIGAKLTTTQINQMVDDITYLGLSGGEFNLRELNIATQLAFRDQGIDFAFPVNDVDDAVQAQNQALVSDRYSDTPDLLEDKINAADEATQGYVDTSTKIFNSKLEKNNSDYDEDLKNAAHDLQKTQNALKNAIPEKTEISSTTPLQAHGKALETALREADPSITATTGQAPLSITPAGAGTKASALLEVTGGNRNISPEVINLFSVGLTPEKFKAAEDYAKANPNSPLGKLYRNQPTVFDQVRFQLGKLGNIEESKLGREIASTEANKNTPLGDLYRGTPSIAAQIDKAGKITKVIDSKLGNKRISVKVKPLSAFSKSITDSFNKNFGKLSPALQNVAKFASNPVGSVKNWAIQKMEQRLGNQLVNAGVKNVGNFILKNGLQGGIKAATSAAVTKIAGWAALKLGVSLALIAVPGGIVFDIALQAAIWLAEKTVGFIYKSVQGLAKSIYGEEIKGQDLAVVGGLALGAGVTFMSGIRLAIVATQAAVISAFTIIMISVTIIGLYLGMVFLVAPILSTLVQLDSVEKVDYTYAPGGTPTLSCANTAGIFVSQRNPAWSGTFCTNCSSSGFCNIGASGCSSASMTMILNSFGAKSNVVNIWNTQHSIGGYVYWNSVDTLKHAIYTNTPPYLSCGGDNNNSLGILTGAGLAVTDVGTNWAEADKVLKNCGLVLATGGMLCGENGTDRCGHLLVIIARNGNAITTMDPWAGENFVHTLGGTYELYRMWTVTK